jgi:hypothetical protein
MNSAFNSAYVYIEDATGARYCQCFMRNKEHEIMLAPPASEPSGPKVGDANEPKNWRGENSQQVSGMGSRPSASSPGVKAWASPAAGAQSPWDT